MKQLLRDVAFLVFFGFCVMSGMRIAEYIWREPKVYLYVCFTKLENEGDCKLQELVPDAKKI
jgi:hypothetical protein